MNKRECANLFLLKKANPRGHHWNRGPSFPTGQLTKGALQYATKIACVTRKKAPYDPWEHLYFDTLPVDTIGCLISYLSAESCRIVLQPGRRRCRYRAQSRSKNIHTILAVPPDTFDLLRFGPRSTVYFCVADRTIWIPRAANLEDFKNIATVYGPYIKKIIMGKLTIPFLYVISELCCGQLRELDISYEFVVRGISSDDLNLNELFANLGLKLESLSISGFGLSENEVSLLMDSIRKCGYIKTLVVRGDVVRCFGCDFWTNVGRTSGKNIEKLSIHYKEKCEVRWASLFNAIIASCPKLKEVDIFPKNSLTYPDKSGRAYFNFLSKLGKNVVRASIAPVPEDLFPQLSNDCPNLRGRLENAAHLSLTPNLLEDIELTFNYRSDFIALSRSLKHCKNLVSLSLTGIIAPTGTRLRFKKSMDCLTSLKLINCLNTTELVRLLQKTPFLTHLRVTTTDKISNGKMFDAIVTSLPYLEHVHVCERRGEDRPLLGLYGQLVKSFSACQHLKRLRIGLYGTIADETVFRKAVEPFRHREISCTLEGNLWRMELTESGEIRFKRLRTAPGSGDTLSLTRLRW